MRRARNAPTPPSAVSDEAEVTDRQVQKPLDAQNDRAAGAPARFVGMLQPGDVTESTCAKVLCTT